MTVNRQQENDSGNLGNEPRASHGAAEPTRLALAAAGAGSGAWLPLPGCRRRRRAAAARRSCRSAGRAPPRQGRHRLDARRARCWCIMMTDPRPGAVLRRHGAREEHAVGADAGVRHVLADVGAVGASTATASRSPRATPSSAASTELFLKGMLDAAGNAHAGRDLQQGRRASPSICSSRSRPPSPAITPA